MSQTLEQRMKNLGRANKIRVSRAALKRDLKAGRCDIREVLRDVPPEVEGMRVGELLEAQHRWGAAKVRHLLAVVHIQDGKPVGLLTERQRDILIDRLEEHERRSAPDRDYYRRRNGHG